MRVGVLGVGHMGSAMARALAAGHEVLAYDPLPETLAKLTASSSVKGSTLREIAEVCDVLICVARPADTLALLAQVNDALPCPKPVLSMAAGITSDKIQTACPKGIAVRCMPNMPAQVGLGVTSCSLATHANEAQRVAIGELLGAFGSVYWLPEQLIDAATALAGSGPGYVFGFIDWLAGAGAALGLPAEVALGMAKQTVLGAATLADRSDKTPGQLCDAVCVPGGTTIAAMNVLLDADAPQTIARALAAAANRAGELANP